MNTQLTQDHITLIDYLEKKAADFELFGLDSIIKDLVFGCLGINDLLESHDSSNNPKAKARNVSGDKQKEIDIISNHILVNLMLKNSFVNLIASEELEVPITLKKEKSHLYNVYLDPLDGSSNIDAKQTVGSIFSIYKNNNLKIQTGKSQISAGYIMYTKPIVLVIAIKNEVHTFNYNSKKAIFTLANKNISLPPKTEFLYANLAKQAKWIKPIKQFTQQFLQDKKSNMRWSGCMVADIHRLLVTGGIFMYPSIMNKKGLAVDKLRLMFEANPMAFIIKNAGGYSSSGIENILDIKPLSTHQKVSVLIGNKEKVKMFEVLIR